MMYDEAQGLATPFLMASLHAYREWTVFKTLPHGGGTMGERQTWLDIIRTLTQEENAYSSWEMDRSRRDMKA